MKNYIGISRDHSGSMQHITRPAMKDFNDNVAAIKQAAQANDIDTIVSVVKCGHGHAAIVHREIVNSNISRLQPLTSYEARAGGTPLWDSVGDLIEQFETVPDVKDPEVTFLLMIITDGEENQSRRWTAKRLGAKIRELQATDRWSFIFRVPRGYSRKIAYELGVHEGNILEWDQTQRGVETASMATNQAFTQFYADRKSGVRSTGRFYANLAAVTPAEVKSTLEDITNEVRFFPVHRDMDIRTFVEDMTRDTLIKGAAFYQLTKTEDVQDYKGIAVRDKTTRRTYSGNAARTMLGLPLQGQIRLSPGNNGNFDVFVQSTSTNRRLMNGTELMYWEGAAR